MLPGFRVVTLEEGAVLEATQAPAVFSALTTPSGPPAWKTIPSWDLVGTIDNGHILVVDDEREICDLVREYLSSEGYRVSTVQDGAGMRRVMAQSPVDLVTLDLMLPGD